MVVIAWSELSKVNNWESPPSGIKEKVESNLIKLDSVQKAKKLGEELGNFVPLLSKLKLSPNAPVESTNDLTQTESKKNATRIFSCQLSFDKDIDFDQTFQITSSFEKLSKSIDQDGVSPVYILDQKNRRDATVVTFIDVALKIASAKIDKTALDDDDIKNAQLIQASAKEFIEKYTQRNYHSTSQLTETHRDLFKNLLFANDELSEVMAVKAIVQEVGLKEFNFDLGTFSHSFEEKLKLAFGGNGVADRIVGELYGKVSNLVSFDKMGALQNLDTSISQNDQAKIKDEFKQLQELVGAEFLKLVDKRAVQKLDKDLGLGLLGNYEKILSSTALLPSVRYDSDSHKLSAELDIIAANYLEMSNTLNDISTQKEYLSKLNNKMLSTFSRIMEDRANVSIDIEINPQHFNQEAKVEFLKLKRASLDDEQKIIENQQRAFYDSSNMLDPVKVSKLVKAEINSWLTAANTDPDTKYHLGAFTISRAELEKMVNPSSPAHADIEVEHSGGKAPLNKSSVEDHIRFKMQSNLNEKHAEISQKISDLVSNKDGEQDKPFTRTLDATNVRDYYPLRRSISRWLNNYEQLDKKIDQFREAVNDSIQEAAKTYAPVIQDSRIEAMHDVASNNIEDLRNLILKWMDGSLTAKAEELLKLNETDITALASATQGKLQNLANVAQFQSFDLSDPQAWNKFISSDFKTNYTNSNGGEGSSTATNLLDTSIERLQELKDAGVDSESLTMLDLSYKRLIYMSFLADIKNSEKIFDLDYSLDKALFPGDNSMLRVKVDVSKATLKRQENNLLFLKSLSDGQPQTLNTVLAQTLREKGFEDFYHYMKDNAADSNLITDKNGTPSSQVMGEIQRQLEKMISSFVKLLFTKTELPRRLIAEDQQRYTKKDSLVGVVGYEVFKHVQKQ
jgi:hypothetical protein